MSKKRTGTMIGFAERLDQLIYESGMTNRQIGDMVGRERKAIGLYRTGAGIPDGVVICKLCSVLKTTPNYLLLGKE